MKFEELKKKLKEEVKLVYLITGSDLFLKKKAQELIREAVVTDYEELNSSYFSTDKFDADKVIEACSTLPFFSNKKLVVVDEYEKKNSDSFTKKLEEYVKNPNESTCLVLIQKEESSYFDSLKKQVEIIDCNPLSGSLLEQIIEADVKKQNKKIDYIAKKLLIEYCGNNLAKINMELLKLLHSINEEGTISPDMVKDNVKKDLEFQIYELTQQLGVKNTQETYVILNTLKENKNTVSSLLSSIYRHFRRLFYIAVNSELSNRELAEKLEVKEFAIKKASEQVKTFGVIKLKTINELCVELDYKTKTGKLNPDIALDYFVLTILNL